MTIIPSVILSGDYAVFEPILRERFPHIVKFRKGDVIFHMDDDRSHVCYYIVSGIVAFTFIHQDGKNFLHSYRGDKTIFPLYYSFPSTALEYTLEVTAQTDVEALRIDKEQFGQMIREYPDLAIATCDAWGRYAVNLVYTAYSKNFSSAENLVCSYLYLASVSDKFCKDGIVGLSHADIGTATGIARENVSKILNQLKKENVIELHRKCIKIIDREKLLCRSSHTVVS